jgi:hypothetical protein
MDSLLVTCIGLEGRYYTLKERLRISFPDLWNDALKALMDKGNKDSLESYFDKFRDRIEEEKEFDNSFKDEVAKKFTRILEEFETYYNRKLVYPYKKLAAA